MSHPSQTAVATGAGRGFGRAIATALVADGHTVVGIARGEADLDAARDELGERFVPVAADATDDTLARDVIHEHRPALLVLNAGAVPPMAPIHEQTWETFSRNWPDAGDSGRRSAEDIAREDGREAAGHKGAAQRPFGTVD
ncbi:SDR family oxidoreductase [Amycolatopsis sp. WQ 127309]|uniref:SDR family oxidoreductase n=1 Tax=Amycolatopsis sp. WQ 127309 TaxID=2932773 RepID=UPI001FF2B9E4|nr:SDR family NAD(P)-dependent oxidoreductase [Amycolatopsis sp. WQ 127309]UOZ07165.1 SDR family oxidoreductase [Amycolatopsis sp. WQ 127309]